jgi:uncharacterized protein YprB with RNaseH-like and TPR domain
MLPHTFCHLPGIGAVKEQKLWAAGFTTWQHLLADDTEPRLRGDCEDSLRESIQRHGEGDLGYFASRLRASQRWRLFPDGRPGCAYLDIETTGLGVFARITTVALYDGRQLRTFVLGQNLNDVPAALADYRLFVTYNGASFDLPMLERTFCTRLTQAHIDLRFVLGALGLKGGLKGCERQLGLERPGLEEVDGFFAVRLWKEYQSRGDPRALETLLAYNAQDTLNLEVLMVEAFNRRVAATPFGHLALPVPAAGVNPFNPDADLIARLEQTFVTW